MIRNKNIFNKIFLFYASSECYLWLLCCNIILAASRYCTNTTQWLWIYCNYHIYMQRVCLRARQFINWNTFIWKLKTGKSQPRTVSKTLCNNTRFFWARIRYFKFKIKKDFSIFLNHFRIRSYSWSKTKTSDNSKFFRGIQLHIQFTFISRSKFI